MTDVVTGTLIGLGGGIVFKLLDSVNDYLRGRRELQREVVKERRGECLQLYRDFLKTSTAIQFAADQPERNRLNRELVDTLHLIGISSSAPVRRLALSLANLLARPGELDHARINEMHVQVLEEIRRERGLDDNRRADR